MLVSVITPSFNNAIFLDSCIRSVRSQRYGEIEHIIMDGGSTDGSIDIIKSYQDYFSYISYGPDDGQSDAINRGIAASTGEVVCWLNSDDAFLPNAIGPVIDYFLANPDCEWLTGHCQFTDIYGNPGWFCRVDPRPPLDYLRFWDGIFLPQPSVFFKRALWDRCGQLDPLYRYAMDLDLWLRFLDESPLHYLNKTLSINRNHPATKTSNGGMDAVLEIASIINRSSLNKKANFDMELIKYNLTRTFVMNQINKYRSELTLNLQNLTSYDLKLGEKMLVAAITARRLIRHVL